MVFASKGEAAEWRMIYDVLSSMEVGDILRYDALDELLGRSFAEEGAKRNPMERARRELEEVDQRTLSVVRGIGYRVVAAHEHMRLARDHQIKSRRQTTKAQQKLESTDLAALTDLELRRHDAMQRQMADLMTMQRQTSRKLARIERVLDDVRHHRME